MRSPLSADELAKLARVRVEQVDEYTSRGLLDPDGDGIFDELDVLRLRILMHYRELGYDGEALEKAIKGRSPGILYSDLLFDDGDEQLSPAGIAKHTGLAVDDVNALRRALGLSGPIPTRDVKFFEAVKGLVDGGVGFKVLIDVARVYGDTMRRLAQTEVRMIRSFADEPGRSSLLKNKKQSERLQEVQQLIGPILEPLLLAVHRQHLLRASVQEVLAELESGSREGDRLEATIVFVDLASFTPMAQVHGDEVAADVLDRFDGLVRELLEAHDGTLIKQIGDAFMLTFRTPVDAVRFGVELDHTTTREPLFPAVRTGINAGSVLYRVGDYVGTTVNLAARIAAIAKANEILVTRPVAEAAEDAGFTLASTGEHRIAGIDGEVELWRVVIPRTDRTLDRDPVCGMAVGEDAVARFVWGSVEYAFCSQDCLRRFLDDPDRYAGADSTPKPEL